MFHYVTCFSLIRDSECYGIRDVQLFRHVLNYVQIERKDTEYSRLEEVKFLSIISILSIYPP